MNILFLSYKVSSGSGVDIATRILANEFVSLGHNISLCSLEISDNLLDVKVKYFYIFGDWKKIDNSQNIDIVKNVIKNENVNIIINQQCQNVPWANLAKKASENSHAKIISCLHFPILMSINYFGKIAKYFPIFFAKYFKKYRDIKNLNYAYNNSDAFVLLSEKFLNHYRELQPRRNLEKLRVIANPLIINSKKINFEKKQKTILFVGRISEFQKRISLIIEIWKIIINSKKYENWNLKIVGDGEDLKYIKEKARNLDRIYFEGKQKAENYFEEASIFFMTSAFEGFPMTLVESLQRACIPIAMDSFLSLGDIIKNNENGIISPNNDVLAFAKNAMLLMDNEQMRKSMGENGIKFVEKFSVKVIVKEWEKLFNEL
jgi:glycosyltransferase involved in cell wall biosynthesis